MKVALVVLAAMLIAAAPVAAPPRVLHLPERPSALAMTADGGALFVGVDRGYGDSSGVIAYRRASGRFVLAGRVSIADGSRALALTPDGETLVVATRVGIATVAVAPLLAGDPAQVRLARDGDAPATSQVAIGRDGRTIFYTNTARATLGVARIERAAGGDSVPRILAHVAVDRAPQGLAGSPDGRFVYVVSEVAGDDAQRVPGAADARLGRTRCASNLGAHGTLSVVDVAAAVADPANAVVARVAAGCGPARVVLSRSGDVAWVTDRGENRVLAFSSARVRSDPAHALLASVAVGRAPVGLALSPDGTRLLVACSNPPADADAGGSDGELSVVDATAAVAGRPASVVSLPTGALPRDVLGDPDGTYLVTNATARSIDLVSLPADIGRNGQS